MEDALRTLLLAALAAGTVLTATTPATARQGCGLGFHRGPYGRCVANRAGGFYHGYGYWDGHRYWHNRYRWHGGWRYR